MSEHDDLTSTLTRELTERAHTVDGSLLHLADVQGRARSIRRRRTATAVAAVAAAVAVVIPTASLATHTGGSPEPGPAITHTPTPTQTQTNHGHEPAPDVLDVSDLPTGAAPGMEYVTDGKVLHRTDGSTVDIGTQHRVVTFAVLKDGSRVWQTDDNGDGYVEVQDADGAYHQPVRSMSGLTVSHSHDAAAWIDPDGQVMVWTAGATAPRPVGDPLTTDGRDLRLGPFESDACQQGYCGVFVNVADQRSGERQPWEVTDYATRPFTDANMLTVADLSGSVFVGLTKLTDFGSCSDVWGGGEFQGFHTCQATLASFSPGPVSTLLGYPPYYDGLGPGALSMWDLDGNKLFERSSDEQHQTTVVDAQWEHMSHLLMATYENGQWALVRIGTDGSMEYAVPPVAGHDTENPFVLPAGGPAPSD